tara:strand:+ start:648 stop:1001 length:354 start_codon:yes stop_codon:yes gene_type:complete
MQFQKPLSFLNPLYNSQQLTNLYNYINLPQNNNFFHTHSLNYIITNTNTQQFYTQHYKIINQTLGIQPTPSNPNYITPSQNNIINQYNPLPPIPTTPNNTAPEAPQPSTPSAPVSNL